MSSCVRKVAFRAIVATLFSIPLLGSVAALAGSDEDRFRAELIAPVPAGDVSGGADFREKDGRRKFSVEIEGLSPNSMFDVEVAGTVVGKVTADEFGFGELGFDDTADPDDEDSPFPEGFPGINGGERVEVGDLAGNLQPK